MAAGTGIDDRWRHWRTQVVGATADDKLLLDHHVEEVLKTLSDLARATRECTAPRANDGGYPFHERVRRAARELNTASYRDMLTREEPEVGQRRPFAWSRTGTEERYGDVRRAN
jgi:hypothetical protein